jgi:hypothetical protein
MASIVIKDLKESVELDRQAMRAISGGSSRRRLGGAQGFHSELFHKPSSFEVFNLSLFRSEPGKL